MEGLGSERERKRKEKKEMEREREEGEMKIWGRLCTIGCMGDRRPLLLADSTCY